ncbi:MAG: bacteriohemerythrin [Gallionella sp.]|nr:bacteriohemerythrin [Gallionella sp.]
MYIHWDDKLRIGNDLIDDEHRLMVMLCKKLDCAIRENVPKNQLVRTVLEMKKFTEFHFVSEENLMLEIGYPGYAMHEQIHSQLLQQLDAVAGRINHGIADPQETLEFIWQWLGNHIEHEDMKIGVYLDEHRRASISQEAYRNIYP